MKYLLLTPLKGGRHYIQGGDLFNMAEAEAVRVTGTKGAYISKLSFSNFAYHLCDLVLGAEICAADNKKIAEGEFALPDGRQQKFLLCEGTQVPREHRPFDEDELVSTVTYTDQAASLQAPIRYSSIEAVIALTKILNYRLSTPKNGKWVFGKLELREALPVIQECVTITRIKGVSGRFSVNEIEIDGITVGTIQFIVGEP